MKQNFVNCKGKKYMTGDTIHILWRLNGSNNAKKYTATFLDCDEKLDEYRFVVDGLTYCFNRICFWRIVDSQANNLSSGQCANQKFNLNLKNELKIDSLLIGWMWYVVIMGILTIFNDRLVGWAVTSVIFFRYRSKKLREEGYKK